MKSHVTTAYTLPTSGSERQTTIVSKCHVVLDWFPLERSAIVARVAGAQRFQRSAGGCPYRRLLRSG